MYDRCYGLIDMLRLLILVLLKCSHTIYLLQMDCFEGNMESFSFFSKALFGDFFSGKCIQRAFKQLPHSFQLLYSRVRVIPD